MHGKYDKGGADVSVSRKMFAHKLFENVYLLNFKRVTSMLDLGERLLLNEDN